MACRSCKRQLRVLTRQANAIAEAQNVATATTARQLSRPGFAQERSLATTPSQAASDVRQGMRNTLAKIIKRSAEPYRVIHATESIYKACTREALYTISPKDIKAGTIPKTPEGEDIGVGTGMWHEVFKLPPTFSTWSQVTMLHMYLIFARVRNLEPETAKSWQRQLVDHFFFDAEERMDLTHGIHSRGLRHRYLKDLFVQWRGIIAAYDEGVVKGDAVLASAVWRNVYKAREDVDVRHLAAIVSWMRLCLKMLDQMPDNALFLQAETTFKWPAKNELTFVDKPTGELEGQLTQKPPVAQKAAV
ncbi:ubiquinol-cytochrome C chaperone-domain-containing protein [Xylariaceae sp. FL0662B]|nr:ubiquinol-cytochrome C chaperone-domain-containing protein [Xylariaceae sp. FL0662B]